jgi:hypothetical protein
MGNIKDRIVQIKESITAAKEEMKTLATQMLHEDVAELFAKHPNLEKFGWRQYTPYFNDGSACIFRASTNYPTIVMHTDDQSEDDEDDEFSKWNVAHKLKNNEELTDKEKAGIDVIEFLSFFDDDTLREIFDDHVTVTIHSNGEIDVEEYEHD